MLKRRRLARLCACLSGIGLLAASGCDGPRSQTPDAVLTPRPGSHVIVVSFDALRPDALGAYGYPRPTSPALDDFSGQALLFENAYASAPKTPTSFAGLFTGRFPSRIFRGWRLQATDTLASRFAAAGYRTAAFANNPQLAEARGFGRGFELYRVYAGGGDAQVARQATRWLAAHRDERVFLWLHLIDPHAPWVRRPEAEALYDAAYTGRFEEHAAQLLTLDDPRELARVRSLYDGEILAVDRIFGEFVGELRDSGLLDDSIVVVTADHGEEFMEHGHVQHGWLTEENIRVPLLIRHPDRPGAHRTAGPVSQIDLLPTLLELAGLPPLSDVDGQSWLRPGDPSRPIIAVANTERGGLGASIRVGDRKLIVRCGRVEDMRLFDLAADPAEQRDLLPAAAAEAGALAAQLYRTLGVEGCAGLAMDSGRDGTAPAGETEGLDPETVEALEALGYLE